jgi:RimJ/RimL family protein N-acetyltransferase
MPVFNSAHVPELTTERLRLRRHRREDFLDGLAMWSDPQVVRFIGGKPSTGEVAWGRMLRYVGHWEVMGYGFWAVEERATGRFVGELGFADFQRDIRPSFEGAPESGWALASWAHGRGFATEALLAAHVWGDVHLPSRRTVCLIDAENAASQRVAIKCGYREFNRVDYLGERSVLFERFRP